MASKLDKAITTIAKASKEVEGSVIVAIKEFCELLLKKAEKGLKHLEGMKNEEVKGIHQVRGALHDLVLVAEKAFVYLDKVDDVIYYCGCDSMAAAREEVRSSVELQQGGGLW